MDATWERLSRDKVDFILWTGDHTSIFEPVVGMEQVRTAIKNVTAGLIKVNKATGAKVFPCV